MKTQLIKTCSLALVLAGSLAACGGRTTDPVAAIPSTPPVGAPADIATSVAALFAYLEQLIARDENSDPVDINGLTLAVDEVADPLPLSF